MTSENRFDKFFDFEPEITYRGALKQFGGTPNQRAFFNTQFENIYNEYEGILGAGLKRGQELGQSFDLAKSYAQEPTDAALRLTSGSSSRGVVDARS
jgi:hypothetical protein